MSAAMGLVEKWLLRDEIPANWQRVCGLAPLFPLIVEWSVCQGDTLSLASMNCLFPQLSGPGGSAALRQVASTFKIAFVHLFREMERNHLGVVYRERGSQASQPSILIVMCVFASAPLKRTEQWH